MMTNPVVRVRMRSWRFDKTGFDPNPAHDEWAAEGRSLPDLFAFVSGTHPAWIWSSLTHEVVLRSVTAAYLGRYFRCGNSVTLRHKGQMGGIKKPL